MAARRVWSAQDTGQRRGFRVRFSIPVRQAEDSDHSPVWAQSKHRRGNPLVGLLVTLLALFGVMTAVLGIKEKSLAESGAVMDGWIAKGLATVTGEAPKVADQVGDAGAVAAKAGDAAQGRAAAASDELKKQ